MKPEFLIRLDASQALGTGHLTRCLIIAELLRERGDEVQFALKESDAYSLERLRIARFSFLQIPEKFGLAQEYGWLKAHAPHGSLSKVLLLDIAHRDTFSDLPGFSAFLLQWKKHGSVALLDGHQDQALITRCSPLPDLAITPYAGARPLARPAKPEFTHLAGPKYFIFDPIYRLTPRPRPIRAVADRVLLTFGGSDPHSITLKILNSLHYFQGEQLDIRVILGASFSEELKKEVEKEAIQLPHPCELIYAPRELFKHMLWSDVALSSSGLTKYELALTGTPTLLTSIDSVHDLINRDFILTGAAIDLGVHSDLTPSQITTSLRTLLESESQRTELSKKGQSWVDADGASRVVDELVKLKGKSHDLQGI